MIENNFNVEFSSGEQFDVCTDSEITIYGSQDHTKLRNRNIPNQHTISAITGLEKQVYTYVHKQKSPSNRWEIQHDLDKFPSVTVVDSAGSVVVGDIDYINNNKVVLTFIGGFSGTAYLN